MACLSSYHSITTTMEIFNASQSACDEQLVAHGFVVCSQFSRRDWVVRPAIIYAPKAHVSRPCRLPRLSDQHV